MEFILDGNELDDEYAFHRKIRELLDLGPYYGHNSNALLDSLALNVERTVTLVWKSSHESRRRFGDDFDRIVSVLAQVKKQDEDFGLRERFDYVLA